MKNSNKKLVLENWKEMARLGIGCAILGTVTVLLAVRQAWGDVLFMVHEGWFAFAFLSAFVSELFVLGGILYRMSRDEKRGGLLSIN